MQEEPKEDGLTSGVARVIAVRGRTFTASEIGRIREVIATSPQDHRRAHAEKVSVVLGWYQANGRLKDRSCREVLKQLEQAGIIELPPPRHPPSKRLQCLPVTSRSDVRLPFPLEPKEVNLEHFRIVTRVGKQDATWNEFVERYHYLRLGVAVGPQMKYLVEVHGEPIACLSFGGAAWKVAARDAWIGWTDNQRKSNLRYVVNNARVLMPPWIRVKNLASRVLALVIRRLPEDWKARYGYFPYLLETFVHIERHAGTCYKASNWVYVGETKGRGKMDRYGRRNCLKRRCLSIHWWPMHGSC